MRIAFSVLVLLLSGCASLGRNECVNADWYAIGLEDGARGRELHEPNRRLAEVEKEIGRIKTALKDGIPNPRIRAQEVERLEALTREAEQLELRIAQYK